MEIYEKFIQPILQNQVATGLSFTALLGMVAYQLRQIPHVLSLLLNRTFIMRLRVISSDDAFKWVDTWLANKLSSSHMPSVILKSESDKFSWEDESDKKKYILAPGAGLNWFWHRSRFYWVEREIGDSPNAGMPGQRRSGPPLENLYIHTFGRSQESLQSIVEEAKTAVEQREVVPVYLWRGYWAKVAGKRLRSLDTVILKDGMREDIIEDINRFINNREYYEKRGIPWRRGLLMSGPPGTGKTSFVLALAAYFKKMICVLNLGSINSDDRLFSAMFEAPRDAIILIEDIDCADASQPRKPKPKEPSPLGVVPDDDDEDGPEGITKAGLLNALDGVTTPDGRILIMTTNFPEKLDAALVRPGRADVHYIFDYLGPLEQERMAELYYGKDQFKSFPWKISPAEMQKAFMFHPDDPEKAREALTNVPGYE